MKSIINQKECKLVEKRSRFISCVFSCDSIDEQSLILKEIRKKHFSATHICYASVINGVETFSDDREPSGTAGAQIALVLSKYKMVNTLCVVIRYFGGIKLGVPGLIEAYKNSAEACFVQNTKEVVLKNEYICKCSYPAFSSLKNYLSKYGVEIYNETFAEDVDFILFLSEGEEKLLIDKGVIFTKTPNTKYI